MRAGAIDLFADLDLQAIAPTCRLDLAEYPDGFERLINPLPVVPWLYTGGLENHPDLLDRLAARLPLWGNAGATLRAVRDPFLVHAILTAANLPSPAVRRRAEGLPRDGSWLVKPLASAGGLGIFPLGPGTEVDEGTHYLQERISGPSFGALFLSGDSGAQLRGVTRAWPEADDGAAPFAYRGSLGPWPCPPALRRTLTAIGEALATATGLRGLFGVDFVLSDGEPWPVEINPRYPASAEVIELATGESLLAEHVRAFSPIPFRPAGPIPTPQPQPWVGKRIVYARRPGRFPEGTTPAIPPNINELPRVADIPAAGTVFQAGDPVCTLLGSGRDLEDCMRRLERRREAWDRLLMRTTESGSTPGLDL